MMKFIVSFLIFFWSYSSVVAQTKDLNPFNNGNGRKLYQKNHGAILGLQKGSGTSLELGYEVHWRKISLLKPQVIGATGNLEYDFSRKIIGYKAGAWMKRGRVNLTYGGNLVYFSDFNGSSKYGINPSAGFRLAGFHFLSGINLLVGDKELKPTTLYISLRYYFPVQNKFTWDRKTQKRKAERKKERERRKKDNANEKKGLRKLFEKF